MNNVVTNPLRENEWSGVGQHWGEPGLQLIARPLDNDTDLHGHMQASIQNERDDIVYGSFRVVLSNVHAEGTRARFGWYSTKGSQSVGFTFPAEQGNIVTLMTGSSQLSHVENYTRSYVYNRPPLIIAGDDTRMHEYRFDYLPDRVDFYIDSFFIYSSPSIYDPQPGKVSLDLWSSNLPHNGPGPDQDTVITATYAKLYFNVTGDADSKTQKKWDDGDCQAWDVADRTEVVPSQFWHAGHDDETFFFSKDYTHKKEALKDTDSVLHLPASGAGMLKHDSLLLAVVMMMVGFAVMLV